MSACRSQVHPGRHPRFEFDGHLRVFGGITHGVADDIFHRAVQQVPHALHEQRSFVPAIVARGVHDPNPAATAARLEFRVGGHLAHQHRQIDRFQRAAGGAVFQFGEQKQLADQFVEPPRLAFDAVEFRVCFAAGFAEGEAEGDVEARQR